MNIRKALEKVIEWQAAASQLKPYLPVQDKVLTTWFKTLQEFKKDLPVLHKLANDALKVSPQNTDKNLIKKPITPTCDLILFSLGLESDR